MNSTGQPANRRAEQIGSGLGRFCTSICDWLSTHSHFLCRYAVAAEVRQRLNAEEQLEDMWSRRVRYVRIVQAPGIKCEYCADAFRRMSGTKAE